MALTLTPPSEADVAREIGRDVDPDAIFAARRHIAPAIGERLGAGACRHLPADDRRTAPTGPDAESVGRRALKNVCLGLLAATERGGRHRAGFLPVSVAPTT